MISKDFQGIKIMMKKVELFEVDLVEVEVVVDGKKREMLWIRLVYELH